MDLTSLVIQQIEQAGFDEPFVRLHDKTGDIVVRLKTTRGHVYEKFKANADTLYGEVAMWLGKYEPSQ